MKKESAFLIVSIFIALSIVMACNKKSAPSTFTEPDATATSVVVPPDNTDYPFESGTVMGWAPKLGGVTGVVNSTDRAYLGTHSLKVNGSFTGGASNSAVVEPPIPSNLVGKKIIARVYLPSDFPGTGG